MSVVSVTAQLPLGVRAKPLQFLGYPSVASVQADVSCDPYVPYRQYLTYRTDGGAHTGKYSFDLFTHSRATMSVPNWCGSSSDSHSFQAELTSLFQDGIHSERSIPAVHNTESQAFGTEHHA